MAAPEAFSPWVSQGASVWVSGRPVPAGLPVLACPRVSLVPVCQRCPVRKLVGSVLLTDWDSVMGNSKQRRGCEKRA